MNTVCSVPIAFACFVVHMILSYIPIVIKTTESTVTMPGQSIKFEHFSFSFSMESVTEEGVLIREQGIVPTGWASVLLLEPRLDTLRERGERERREREEREGEEERGSESNMCACFSLLNFTLGLILNNVHHMIYMYV